MDLTQRKRLSQKRKRLSGMSPWMKKRLHPMRKTAVVKVGFGLLRTVFKM